MGKNKSYSISARRIFFFYFILARRIFFFILFYLEKNVTFYINKKKHFIKTKTDFIHSKMKIILMGLIVAALTDVNVVASSENNENYGQASKSQLDNILAMLQQQQDQIREQQDQNKEQEQKLEEFMKINRVRRSDNDNDIVLVKDLKKFVLEEIHPLINGLSQCAVGTYATTAGTNKPGNRGFVEWKEVSFGKTFSRTPRVVTSVSGFERIYSDKDTMWGVLTGAVKPTTTKFDLFLQGLDTGVFRLEVNWIACA